MGIDAYFAIKFKVPPSDEDIKNLRYHLLHRFKDILYWKDSATREDRLIKVLKYSPAGHEEKNNDDRFYDIDTMVRFYGKGYERGPGLEIAALLLYLTRHPLISEVWYGGDAEYKEYRESDALQLLFYWLDNGRLPYLNHRMPWDEKERPKCDWCNVEMWPHIWHGNKVGYRCLGCEEEKTVEE